MKKILLISLLCCGAYVNVYAQDEEEPKSELSEYSRLGDFQLGMRTTASMFGHDDVTGFGVGGHYRIQALKFLNTEWFADWITLDLNGAGTRYNAHIGWSVMFYPKQFGRFIPYIMAGHCFDYARVVPLSTPFEDRSNDIIERWSAAAAQMGLGAHYYLNDRFNLTLSAQYMIHLTKHLDYEMVQSGDQWYVDTGDHVEDNHAALEGHFLVTGSLSYRLFSFSKKHRRNK